MSDDYSDREMRLINERDLALTRSENLEQALREALVALEDANPVGPDDRTASDMKRWRALVGEPGKQKPKAIITLTDGDEEGEVSCSIDFIPPVEKGGRGTPAQAHALDMLSSSLKAAKKHTEPKFRAPRKKR